MSWRSLAGAWNCFFFQPIAPTPIALYRILYGLLVTANLILLCPDWLTWYGTRSFLSMETIRRVAVGTRLNLFTFLPQNDWWIWAFFGVFLLFAVFLTIGFETRISSVVVYLCLTSLHQRNFFILHSGDGLMRVTGFFLMFAPAGAALSVDRLLRIWRGEEGTALTPHPPWAQRMIQFETAVAYFATFYWKTLGRTWLDGTALYYALRLEEFRRFPMPEIEHPFLLKLGSWMTLFIEFCCGVLIWFRETRYAVLLLGVCLQLGIEYTMNVPLFEWMILSTYVTFIPPEDLTRFWAWIRRAAVFRWPGSAAVVYDGSSLLCARTADVLRAVDIFGRLQVVDMSVPEAAELRHVANWEQARKQVLAVTNSGVHQGLRGLMALAPFVPLLWPLAPLTPLIRHSKHSFKAAEAAK